MSIEGLPRFSDGEMARRLAAVRGLAQERGVRALLLFGHSGSRRHYQADIHYVTEVAPFHEAYCLVPVEGEPVLWITHHNHFATARDLSRIADVRRSSRDAPAVIAAELRSRGLADAAIGLVGPMFHQEHTRLLGLVPDAQWSDLSMPFKRLRIRKSEEELAWQRVAAAGCDRVMAALHAAIRPGVEERELLVLSEEVAWQFGCQPNFLYLNSTPMAASESCVPNQILSRRKLQMGDVINTELTVSYGMYSAQLLRPFFLGEPTAQYAHLYGVLKTAHDALAEAMKPGVTLDELREVSLSIRDAGYTTVDGLLHGFGVDILPPALGPNFAPPHVPYTLEPGVTIVLQPNPTTADERVGMQLGQMGLITPHGYVSMHASPSEVTVCG
ncbi:M24 family metallopeptidase [Pseudacidovorax sp. NFM-22]|uniref:M24 family metallopeptidase n=1 Tax=Pseudacidovorax sp. NFM-22 TaxID=2744469 RepID=UPI001F1AF0A5|nr:M24 family metallopeptidase [Pseudacidovorax sp. NFM-22]